MRLAIQGGFRSEVSEYAQSVANWGATLRLSQEPPILACILVTDLARRNHPSESLRPPARQLPMIRLHDLRHLRATLLLLEGVPVHVVANRLGHSDPSVTLRVYAHVLRESASGVADIFARAVERMSMFGTRLTN